MSEPKLVSPLLDGFVMGHPMSSHDGIACHPAMKEETGGKYIVKIISIPASQVQLDALLLTGAHKDPAEAMDYFREVADGIAGELEILNGLAKLEGFLPYEGFQIVPMEEGKLGYQVYLLSSYRRSVLRHMKKNPMTHLDAVNLGLDLCASLAICRRAGYLYVDLKPSNVFLTKEKQFRIGDLGFVKLDSLAYTALPGKYRSAYSPAELQDDMKTLNTTVDTYAVGMILYQIYNEGILPAKPLEPTDPFPHPMNADYEIGSIIMKALDPNPANRWADPMEMGQALVGYMQRNSVNNVPIVPPSGFLVTDAPAATAASVEDPEPEQETSAAEDTPLTVPEAPETEDASPVVIASESADDIQESTNDLSAPEEEDEDLDFSLAFLDPEPVEEVKKPVSVPQKAVPVRKTHKRRKARATAAAIVILALLAVLGCGGFWFYQTQYLQTIDSLTLEGTQHELTVTVDSDMDMSLLQVICTDAYGNSMQKNVTDGQAVFTDLLPDSLYRIELSVTGFHALTGKTAEIFTTDAIPSILSMSAVTGPEDGSVIVNFTVDGSDPEEWVITCSADGEEDIVEHFTGHSVTLKGLTVDTIYTLTLSTNSDDQILGISSMDFAASALILAENLTIADITDGVMTVRWDAPEGSSVEKWTVRCYNDAGHEEVLEISGTEIAFTGIDTTKSYTVEVTAAGMTQPQRISISENPLSVTDLTVNSDEAGKLSLSWTHDGPAPEGGWLLMYTLDGSGEQPNVVKCPEASALIEPRIPNAGYTFTIQAVDSTTVFNNVHSYICPGADIYSNEGLSAANISAHLVKTPEDEDWTIDSIGEDAFTDTFQTGEHISLVLTANDNFYLPERDIDVLYVIRDGNGNVLSQYISTETRDWKALWYEADYHNGELNIPKVPEEPGDYSLSLYFDNMAVTAINFTITE